MSHCSSGENLIRCLQQGLLVTKGSNLCVCGTFRTYNLAPTLKRCKDKDKKKLYTRAGNKRFNLKLYTEHSHPTIVIVERCQEHYMKRKNKIQPKKIILHLQTRFQGFAASKMVVY